MSNYTYPFEKLDAWKEAKGINIQIYKITTEFPDVEKYGLVSQMRRSAISVCSNLAEGSSRRTKKDQGHFYTMAYSSLMELLNQCIISEELSFLKNDAYLEIRKNIESTSKKIYALRVSVLK
ncbi:four helix bundle protein [Membranicola marinus]|uniref:Four helix bundle protein n=1 Tax=Membranihabitans marinus TaxID=1227546 RepID=A0A953L9G2_9BACT|nr:four helix bundle protein [Membranihabitans marinus]MBY5956621.1 four helix bundle protein [Membranihabitans marinus]